MFKVFVMSFFVAIMFSGCVKMGQGEKIGQVVKINEASGFINKTIEVEIMRGGFNGGSGVNGNSLHFTVTNQHMLDQLKIAMDQGKEVKIYWDEYLIGLFTSDSNNIYGVRAEFLMPKQQRLSNSSLTGGLNQGLNITTNQQDQKTTRVILNVLKTQHDALIIQNEALQSLIEKNK